jgi:5-methyltetrahydropteroyltriglutamate--homocysteine methyltransferase
VAGEEAEGLFVRAAQEVIADQVAAGIDIPTDGEVRRENYIHYHCRHLDGIDFETLTEKELRGGAYSASLPTITGPVAARDRFLPHDWKAAQGFTDRPVKVTMPGPMTITDTVANSYYGDGIGDRHRPRHRHLHPLAEAGCTHIQIDEPVFARKPELALSYGFENLERCFHGAPGGVVRTVHMCCGYPDRLDNPDYPKADRDAYLAIADAIEQSTIQAVSLEDAHRHNDLRLLEQKPRRDGRRDPREAARGAGAYRCRAPHRRARLRPRPAGPRPRRRQLAFPPPPAPSRQGRGLSYCHDREIHPPP